MLSIVKILTIWYSAWASLMLLWMRCEKESHCSVARACQNRAYIPPFYFVQYYLELWKKEPTIFFSLLSKHSEFSNIFYFYLFLFGSPKVLGRSTAVTFFSWSKFHFYSHCLRWVALARNAVLHFISPNT